MNAIKIPKQYSSEYVCCLPLNLQSKIMNKICEVVPTLLLTPSEKGQAIKDAYNEKVTNLTDTIKIKWI